MPSAGPQTMPLPRLAMCNCLTTSYSFPLENLAGPLCPVSSSCHIRGFVCQMCSRFPGTPPWRAWPSAVASPGLLMGRGVRSRACVVAGNGMHPQPTSHNSSTHSKWTSSHRCGETPACRRWAAQAVFQLLPRP